jgi:hypothetical protein
MFADMDYGIMMALPTASLNFGSVERATSFVKSPHSTNWLMHYGVQRSANFTRIHLWLHFQFHHIMDITEMKGVYRAHFDQ